MQPSPLISVAELQQAQQTPAGDILVIDCRFDLSNPQAGQQQYAQNHLPGAVFLDLDKDLCGVKTGTNGRHPLPERETLAQKLRTLGVNQNTSIIVYDQQDSMFAAHLWWLLQWLGHTHVRVLDGGLVTWENKGGPLSTELPPARPEGNFQAQQPLTPTVNADQILRNLGSSQLYIIDARAPERFRGEVEPLDPAAGHIPGAINRFFKQNLQADGTFKAPEQLHQKWVQILNDHPLDTVVHQCGSGVSACHNLLSMVHAGFNMAALYPGSWSEWSASPERPIAQE